ncbi:hypothetical protein AND_004638 [Anopheles darlingi]|uniref:Endoplasmic reticulum-based factor for assembly of v-atpase n=1 Tax=Anopheles darlingi TaxID=43151 RepID=W5JL54_ANODA|nr:hypothetical protein AND_004638 [Anopheles darlingi]
MSSPMTINYNSTITVIPSKQLCKIIDEEYRSIRQYLNEQNQVLNRESFGFSYSPQELGRTSNQANASRIRLDLNDLKWLYTSLAQMRGYDASVPYLHSLLADCWIVLPERSEQDPSSVCSEVDCAQKVRKEKQVENQQMTRSSDTARKPMPGDTIDFPLKHLNRHLLAVAQFACSVVAGFVFGFIGIELLVGQLDFGFRLLLGVMIGLIVALSEIYFLAQKLNEEDDVSLPSSHPTLQSMAKSTQKTHQD